MNGNKVAQLLIGPTGPEEIEDNSIRLTLIKCGYKVIVVPIDRTIDKRQPNLITEKLNPDANITVANSGIRWDNITRLTDISLFPNAIVITSNPSLQFSWKIKPIIVIARYISYSANLTKAIYSLSEQPLRYPSWLGIYKETNYGWLLLNADEELFALGAWEKLRTHVLPGFKFSAWSSYEGNLDDKFKVVSITNSLLMVLSESDNQLKTISKIGFCEIAINWKAYRCKMITDSHIKRRADYCFYINGLLHWLDIEGHLTNIKEE